MRKYFTRRCVLLHLLLVILVPAFLAAGWWQYEVAKGGNDLSWVYTVEWPLFAVYAVYMWWKLIHDQSTPIDRFWARKQRAAAEAAGTPLHQIPGWARDKELARAVRATAGGNGRTALGPSRAGVLESGEQEAAPALPETSGTATATTVEGTGSEPGADGPAVIEARILDVKVSVDEELEAYNRYLFDLHQNGPPKRWHLPGHRAPADKGPTPDTSQDDPPGTPGNGPPPELSSGGD